MFIVSPSIVFTEPPAHTHKHAGIATATWETADKHRAAYLAGVAPAGKEVATVVSMERDVQNTGVAVEGLLSAVAMVNVLDRDSGTGLARDQNNRYL